MTVPLWVPMAVSSKVRSWLEGPSGGFFTGQQDLATAEIELRQSLDHPEGSARRLAARDRHESLKEDVACLCRLVKDSRMEAAYAKLALAQCTDRQLIGFVASALMARRDYNRLRDEMQEAEELAKEVALVAAKLSKLLIKSERYGKLLPAAFSRAVTLVSKSDHASTEPHVGAWQAARRVVCGRSPSDPDHEPDWPGLADAKGGVATNASAVAVDPVEATRKKVRAAWSAAPSTGRLVATLTREADAWVATRSIFINAPLIGRKRSTGGRTDYLRAFGGMACDIYGIALGPDILNAMAITAAVVLEIDVAYDDARKACANFVPTIAKDSTAS